MSFGYGCNSAAIYPGSNTYVGTKVTCVAGGGNALKLPDGEYMTINYFPSTQGCVGATNQTRIIRLGVCNVLSPLLSYAITWEAGVFSFKSYTDTVCKSGASIIQTTPNYACKPHSAEDSPFQASLLVTEGMSKGYVYVNVNQAPPREFPTWTLPGLGAPETLGVVILIIIMGTLFCGKLLQTLLFQ
jgi:hypothetical protein